MLKSIEQYTSDKNEHCEDRKCYFCIQKHEECKAGNFPNVDFNKPGIMIIDDNRGICSFLEDDFQELDEQGKINIDDYNIFQFYGRYCAYEALNQLAALNMNIQYAIIDITYGGTIKTSNGNLKLTGVDVFEVLYEANPKIKYLFYTGNQMNDHIKTIGIIMEKYTNITGKKITDNMLFKTQFSMDDRQKFIYEHLLKDEN